MQWIKYQIVQSIIDEETILIEKKVGYSEANLAIAQAEAYNGEYTIEEDGIIINKKPIAIEFGGTGADNAADARIKLGAAESSHVHDDRYYTESEIDTKLGTKVNNSEKGVANGVATLDGKGKVTANQASSSIVVIEANTTLSASHLGKFLNAASASAITITIPNSSDIPVGAEVEIYHHGAGAVYVQSDANTYFSFDGKSTTSRKLTIPRFGAVGMKKVTTATWKVSGEAEG